MNIVDDKILYKICCLNKLVMQPLLLELAHMSADRFCHQSRLSDDFSMKIIIITMLMCANPR